MPDVSETTIRPGWCAKCTGKRRRCRACRGYDQTKTPSYKKKTCPSYNKTCDCGKRFYNCSHCQSTGVLRKRANRCSQCGVRHLSDVYILMGKDTCQLCRWKNEGRVTREDEDV